jgi:uncharacterized Ntn-hydrolase superfamily protein
LVARDTRDIVATFSIVAFDPETDALGVAVQSTFLAVGSIVPWARAGAGQALGGDSRGKQSAALLIVRKEAGTAATTIGSWICASTTTPNR